MKLKLFSLTTMLVIMLYGCSNNKHHAAGANRSALPAFEMKSGDGALVNLESFKGKKIMVNLWASWCPPCVGEMPSIEQLAAQADTSKAVIVLLSLDRSRASAYSFMQGKRVNKLLYFPAGELPPLFDVQAIPATFFFDETGKLVKTVEGGTNYNTAEYKRLLQ